MRAGTTSARGPRPRRLGSLLFNVAVLSGPILFAVPWPAPAQPPEPAAPADTVQDEHAPVRLFFLSDVHSRYDLFERVVADANRERPDLILEAGDFVHDGTRSEFHRAYRERARLEPPWHLVKGNHDAQRAEPSQPPPPPIPEFEAFNHEDVRFILLDNHRQVLTEDQFQRLEEELAAHDGGRIIVAMHVPPFLAREPFLTRLRHIIPFDFADPAMRDPDQVARFKELMARHRVLAVLSGHAHFGDDRTRDGVRYITAGAVGGLVPGLGFQREYVDITLDGRDVLVNRVTLKEPAGDPVTFVARVFRFFARVNGLSRETQGWSFVPSASVQLRSGLRLTEADGGENAAVFGYASFERLLGGAGRHSFFADLGLSAATRELSGHFDAGYKLRPVGDFNRNVFVSLAAASNAGVLRGAGTAGIGARFGVGLEWRGITAELMRHAATNHRATALAFGRRF